MDFNKVINKLTTGQEDKALNTKEGDIRQCSICGKDLQAIKLDLPNGTARFVVPKCKCEKEKMLEEIKSIEGETERQRIRNLFSISNVGEKYLKADFEGYEQRPGSEFAYKVAKHYAMHFKPEQKDGIMIYGDVGNGKTMLTACIHNHLKVRGHTVVFISMPDLLTKIKATFNKGNAESEQHIMKALMDCDLLILDDLGAEKTSDWVQEKIFEIIDGRYRREKPIVCTTNISPKYLPEVIGKRSVDRLNEVTTHILNEAASYRRETAIKNLGKYDFLKNTDI